MSSIVGMVLIAVSPAAGLTTEIELLGSDYQKNPGRK